MSSATRTFYVGTYTSGESEGIYRCLLNLDTGAMDVASLAAPTQEPSFLIFHPNKPVLYAANELMEFEGKPGGAVSAFAIDSQSADLTFLNQQPTHGAAPCHMSIDKSEKWLMVANYFGGNAAVYPILDTGGLGSPVDIIQHEGKGPNVERQEKAHAHSITPDHTGRFVYIADLGIDRLVSYHLDAEKGKLLPHESASVSLPGGAGPRHITFHPSQKYVYLINELNATITAYVFNETDGSLDVFQTVSTLPEDFSEYNISADIHVTPDGRFLYGSNRGHDSLAIFAIDEQTGRLSFIGHEATRGKWPRNFAIVPEGTMVVAANQNSHTIRSFFIDQQTGRLAYTGHCIEVPSPVCIALQN